MIIRLHAYLWLVVVCRVTNLLFLLPTRLISTREEMTFDLRFIEPRALRVNRLLRVCPVPPVVTRVVTPGLGFRSLTVLLSSGMLDRATGVFPGWASVVTLLLLSYGVSV